MTAALEALLRERFGHERFRPGQREAIEAALAGRDVLAVLPTGSGKSLIYQLAAEMLPGATVVVSPLIALMADQAAGVEDRGDEVGVINSTLSERRAGEEMEEVQEGAAKLLYVTPERFGDQRFLRDMRDLDVSLMVVDEAHCVSQWGHSFRPAYLELATARAALGGPPAMALTATANPFVRREIVARLELRDPAVVARGGDRPNLFFEAERVERPRDKRRALRRLFDGGEDRYGPGLSPRLDEAMRGPGIIYAGTTRAARETAAWLRERGVSADHYHGRRRTSDRERVHEGFHSGDIRVVVATNAFGLGIDKPDVRFVVHLDVPPSVEAYYQEAGRAGRDGDLARCVLLYRPADMGRAAALSGTGELTREEVQRGLDALRGAGAVTAKELSQRSGLGRADVAALLDILVAEGAARRRRGRVTLADGDVDAARLPLDGERRRRAYDRSRLEMMRALAETDGCRRAEILAYFGEDVAPGGCGMCDNDLLHGAGDGEDEGDAPAGLGFRAGDRVAHATMGEGVVQRVTGERITVLLDDGGYTHFATGLVRDGDLIAPA